jgi:hypothetical protein
MSGLHNEGNANNVSPVIRMSSRRTRFIFWSLATLAFLAVIGAVTGYVMINRYLAGDKFRRMLADRAGGALEIQAEFDPLRWAGTSIYTDGFKGHGGTDNAIRILKADRIRADLDLAAIFRGVWQIDTVEMETLSLQLQQTPTPKPGTKPAATKLFPTETDGAARPDLPFLPKKTEIRKLTVRDATLSWPMGNGGIGSIEHFKITATPDQKSWIFTGEGGVYRQPGLPPLNVDHYRVRFTPPSLLFVEARLSDGKGGTADIHGEIDAGAAGQLDLTADLNKIVVTPFLPDDWRARFHGNLSGPIRLKGIFDGSRPLRAEGSIAVSEGSVEALPVLNQVASLTQTAEFRSMKLQQCRADFAHEGGNLDIRNLLIESQLLLKVTGGLRVEGHALNGTFDLGTTPKAVRLIPGATSQVFTSQKDGYVWTTVQLRGTVEDPQEDLTPRLKSAAVNSIIDAMPSSIQQKAGDVLDYLKNQLP